MKIIELKGFVSPLFFIAGTVLLVLVFVWGIAEAAALFLPLLIVVCDLLVVFFLCGVIPLTLIKKWRPYLGLIAVLMANVLGVFTWMASFFFVVKAFGFWGIFLSFLFQLLAPLVLIVAALKGSWFIAENLALWICFTYVMRFYNIWLLSLSDQSQKNNCIIDVDAVEVK